MSHVNVNASYIKIETKPKFFRYEIMESCWNLNPDLRPSFEELQTKFNRIQEELHLSNSLSQQIKDWYFLFMLLFCVVCVTVNLRSKTLNRSMRGSRLQENEWKCKFPNKNCYFSGKAFQNQLKLPLFFESLKSHVSHVESRLKTWIINSKNFSKSCQRNQPFFCRSRLQWLQRFDFDEGTEQ